MSHKHSIEIARELKGRTVGEAIEYLEAVNAGDEPVPFRRHNRGSGHRANIDGWDTGKFPKKASEAFLDLLHNAVNNADNQGFDGESMEIEHCAAHKVDEVEGIQPRAMGRATNWNSPLVDVELIIKEVETNDG